jgi:hypothetical protein
MNFVLFRGVQQVPIYLKERRVLRDDIRNAPVFFTDLIKTIETNSEIQEYIARFFIKEYIEKYLLLYNKFQSGTCTL